jgi:hypothetical protein
MHGGGVLRFGLRKNPSTALRAVPLPAKSRGGIHAPGETVDLSSLPRQAKRAGILRTRLAKER